MRFHYELMYLEVKKINLYFNTMKCQTIRLCKIFFNFMLYLYFILCYQNTFNSNYVLFKNNNRLNFIDSMAYNLNFNFYKYFLFIIFFIVLFSGNR